MRVIKADLFVRRAPGGFIFATKVRAENRMTTTSAVIGRARRTKTPSQRVRATTCTSLSSSGAKRGCHKPRRARRANPGRRIQAQPEDLVSGHRRRLLLRLEPLNIDGRREAAAALTLPGDDGIRQSDDDAAPADFTCRAVTITFVCSRRRTHPARVRHVNGEVGDLLGTCSKQSSSSASRS